MPAFNEGEEKMNDVKPMKITDTNTGMVYTLEFDKESVRYAESRGFNIEDVAKFPISKTEELFWYAFRKNHKKVDILKARQLLEGIGTLPEDFMERLLSLYAKPYEAFIESEDEVTPFVKVD